MELALKREASTMIAVTPAPEIGPHQEKSLRHESGPLSTVAKESPARRSSPCIPATILALFAILNLADFALTHNLLQTSGETIYESNPVAQWCLENHGWLGLASFKAATALVVALSALTVVRRRPLLGNLVLAFVCVPLAVAVAYGGYLCASVQAGYDERDAFDSSSDVAIAAESARLNAIGERSRAFHLELEQVLADLRARRCGLKEGVDRLASMERIHDHDFQRSHRALYPGLDTLECLAADLITIIALDRSESPAMQQIVSDLSRDFRELFGIDVSTESHVCVGHSK
jgi:hypothetical protein